MHLVTGLLIAGLMGKRKSSKKRIRSPLLMPGGPVEVVHMLPGRVRFRVEALKSRQGAASGLTEQLLKIEGVDQVETSAVTGSVLITYHGEQLDEELLVAAIVRLLGLAREVESTGVSRVARGVHKAGDALNSALLEETNGVIDLWTAVPIALGILGVRKLIQEGGASLPQGFTLLWWAYIALLRRR